MEALDTPTRSIIEATLADMPTPKVNHTTYFEAGGGLNTLESPPVKINHAHMDKVMTQSYLQGQQDVLRDKALMKCKETFIQGIHTKIHKLYQKQQNWEKLANIYSDTVIDDAKLLQELLDIEENGCELAQLYGYFITINPSHDTVEPEILLKKVAEKICAKKGITKWMYVFEQTGDTEETLGYNPHVHILVERSTTNQGGQPKKLKKGIENTISSIFGKDVNFNIKVQKKGKEEVRIKYMLGSKSDISKLKAVELNETWRKENNLKQYYTNY